MRKEVSGTFKVMDQKSVKNLGMVALHMRMWALNVRQMMRLADNRNDEQGETGETEYHWL
jgi:hypothetical protein